MSKRVKNTEDATPSKGDMVTIEYVAWARGVALVALERHPEWAADLAHRALHFSPALAADVAKDALRTQPEWAVEVAHRALHYHPEWQHPQPGHHGQPAQLTTPEGSLRGGGAAPDSETALLTVAIETGTQPQVIAHIQNRA
jgi:hypothetical protein